MEVFPSSPCQFQSCLGDHLRGSQSEGSRPGRTLQASFEDFDPALNSGKPPKNSLALKDDPGFCGRKGWRALQWMQGEQLGLAVSLGLSSSQGKQPLCKPTFDLLFFQKPLPCPLHLPSACTPPIQLSKSSSDAISSGKPVGALPARLSDSAAVFLQYARQAAVIALFLLSSSLAERLFFLSKL